MIGRFRAERKFGASALLNGKASSKQSDTSIIGYRWLFITHQYELNNIELAPITQLWLQVSFYAILNTPSSVAGS